MFFAIILETKSTFFFFREISLVWYLYDTIPFVGTAPTPHFPPSCQTISHLSRLHYLDTQKYRLERFDHEVTRMLSVLQHSHLNLRLQKTIHGSMSLLQRAFTFLEYYDYDSNIAVEVEVVAISNSGHRHRGTSRCTP
jgi:hypothetical protein